MTVTAEARTTASPYRVFRVFVSSTQRLSPAFLRLTFTGPDLDRFADEGFDQRVVLALPLPGVGYAHLPNWEDWHPTWRLLPDEHRNPLRTYTARSVRPHLHEVDVDVVLHPHGLASRWAKEVRPGHAAALVGPDNAHRGERGSVEFQPPENDLPVLLAGDETAVPAIAAILERLPRDASGDVLLEVPCAEDALNLQAPPGVRITWLPRAGRDAGAELTPAARTYSIIGKPYAWVAGEASMVRDLRHHFVHDRAFDRRLVSCRGYWRCSH